MRTQVGRALGALLVAALGAALLVASPVSAGPPPTIDSVSFARTSLTTSGVRAVAQSVSAHIADGDAVGSWAFMLTGSGGTGNLRSITVYARLTAGTTADGTWTASYYVPSTADGTWHLTSASTCDGSGGCGPAIAVASSPTYRVTGHHQPRMSLRVVPSPLPHPRKGGTLRGRVVDSDTGKGMAGVAVGYGSDTSCVPDPLYSGRIGFNRIDVTSSTGYYTLKAADLRLLDCVGLFAKLPSTTVDPYAGMPVFRTFSVPIKPTVTARAASSRAGVGSPVAVRGTVLDWGVWDGRGRVVLVQQLHGRSAWRTVATVKVRLSGRWNAVITPTVRGANVFRAVTPAYTNFTASASGRFVVVGVRAA